MSWFDCLVIINQNVLNLMSCEVCEINPRGRFPHTCIRHAGITKVCYNRPYPMSVTSKSALCFIKFRLLRL